MRLITHQTSALARMIVAATLAMFLLPVFAPDARAADSRWYVGLNVPVMFIDDSESVERGEVPRGPVSIPYKADAVNSYKTGFRVSGTLGYEFGTGFRVDGEVFFARAAIGDLTYKGRTTTVPTPQGPSTIRIPGERPIDVSGSANQLGGMVNVWYDFDTGSRWRPYVGGGLGLVQVDWGGVKYKRNEVAQGAANQLALLQVPQQVRQMIPNFDLLPQVAQDQALEQARAQALAGAVLDPGTVPELSDTDTVFAYQVGAGMGYEVTDAITVQLGYRLLKANQLEFTGRSAMGATATATTEMQVHLFEIGVRYRF